LDKHAADLADLLSTYLSSDDRVKLVERERLANVLQEQALALSQGKVDQAQIGQLLGSQRFLYTSMVQADRQVRLDAQLVEPQSGLFVGATSLQGPVEGVPALLQQLAGQLADRILVGAMAKAEPLPTEPPEQSLEAAIHHARGLRMETASRYEEAVKELEQAAFLAPDYVEIWRALGRVLCANRQYDDVIRYGQQFIARRLSQGKRGNLKDIPLYMAFAQEKKRNWPGLEEATRLLLSDRKLPAEGWLTRGHEMLLEALVKQGKWEEAVRFCEGLSGKATDEVLAIAWASLCYGVMHEEWDHQDGDEPGAPPGALAVVRRAIAALPAGNATVDRILGHYLFWPISQHCLHDADPGAALYRRTTHDLAEGLAVATEAAEKFKNGSRTPAMAHLTRAMLLARLDRPKEALHALETIVREYPSADIDYWGYEAFAPPANGMAHFFTGLIYEHLGNRAQAAAGYREAVRVLNPTQDSARRALARLREWNAALPPQAAWEKRVESFPALYWTMQRTLVAWLRKNGYQFWGENPDQGQVQLGTMGTLFVVYNGLRPNWIPAEQLRSWVVQGGRLLVVCRRPVGEVSSRGTAYENPREILDPSMNWLTTLFGITLDPTSDWVQLEGRKVAPTSHPLAQGLESFEYGGDGWRIICPEEWAVLRIANPSSGPQGSAVMAARQMGLGRVAAVTLRNWFPSYDTYPGGPWEEPLFARTMEWLTEAPSPEQRKLVDQAAKAWGQYLEDGAYWFAEPVAFASVARLGGPWGQEAQFTMANAYARQVEERHRAQQTRPRDAQPAEAAEVAQKAERIYRQLIRAGWDEWLQRAAALNLGRLLWWQGDGRKAIQYYRQAAAVHGDPLWAAARVEEGDITLEAGDFASAESSLREVTTVAPHTKERLRALYGLGYALERQGRTADAARVYRALEEEYGLITLGVGFEALYADPWHLYYPESVRPS